MTMDDPERMLGGGEPELIAALRALKDPEWKVLLTRLDDRTVEDIRGKLGGLIHAHADRVGGAKARVAGAGA